MSNNNLSIIKDKDLIKNFWLSFNLANQILRGISNEFGAGNGT